MTPPIGDATPHRGEHMIRTFGEEFRSPSVAGSPVPFPSDVLDTVEEMPVPAFPSEEEDEAAEAAGRTAAWAAAAALDGGGMARDSPLPMPLARRHVELAEGLPRSRPGTPSQPADSLTPVRPTPVRPPDLKGQVPEGSPVGGWSLERPPTASTRPSTANASAEATPSRLGSLSPESAGIKLDPQMRGVYGYPSPSSPDLLPPHGLDLPPFPAGFSFFAPPPGGERPFAFPRPMTTPPDFLRVEPPAMPVAGGPGPTQAEREQAYADLKGRVVEFSKSQVGSRYLQRQLRKDSPELVQLIVLEVLHSLPELMCDTYGNYLAQQLFGACNAPLRAQILERLMPCARDIACDRRGTHALQALMSYVSTAEERALVQGGLQRRVPGTSVPLVAALAFDAHGTHVVQKILVCFDPASADFIYQTAVPMLDQLAQHTYGLCVVKKCIAQANEPQKQRIIKKLAQHATDLCISAYGNYAIQAALENWSGVACRPIILKLKSRVLQLAIQKFSSNVVEKCIAVAEPHLRLQLIDELVADRNSVHVLMESQYGMYAIQKALHHAGPRQLQDMKAGIQKHVGGLHNRKMRSKWEKLLAQLIALTERPGRPMVGDPLLQWHIPDLRA